MHWGFKALSLIFGLFAQIFWLIFGFFSQLSWSVFSILHILFLRGEDFEGEKPLLGNYSTRFGIKHILSAADSQKCQSIRFSSTANNSNSNANGQVIEEILRRKIQEYNDQNSPIRKVLVFLGFGRFYSMCTDHITWLTFPLPRIKTKDGTSWMSCEKVDCIHLVRKCFENGGNGGFEYNVYFVKNSRIFLSSSDPQEKINHFKYIENVTFFNLRNPIATVAVQDGSPNVFVQILVWLVIILIPVAIFKTLH